MLRFRPENEWFFLRSEFDEDEDDYSESYKVYRLPFHSEEEIASHPNYWMELSGADYLGQIPVAAVGFDETRRQSIDARAFVGWLSSRRADAGIASRS